MKLPPIKLDRIKALTDDTGILQHTKYSIPDRKEGYTTDDNARALVAAIKYYEVYGDQEAIKLADIYLSFLLHMQMLNGKFHNLLAYDRDFLDDVGSEDCMGRALWACGYAVHADISEDIKLTSKEIFDKGLRWASNFKSLRAKALTILGLHYYQRAFPKDSNLPLNTLTLADTLLDNYQRESSHDWRWFESCLTYVNARLPQALFMAYDSTKNERYLHVAKESFDFLVKVQTTDDKFVPIGNDGWYKRGGERALYDQQPIEASCMVEAALTAFRLTGDGKYRKAACLSFDWFLGRNLKGVEVYNPATGGCYDGITPQGLNLNQGAEATISYLLSRLKMEKSKGSLRGSKFLC